METIFILIATTDCSILKNKRLLGFPTSEHVQMIISNQKINIHEDLIIHKDFTLVINTESKGISLNRNLLLQSVTKGIAIFCDDDVYYLPELENIVRSSFFKNPHYSILGFKIISENNEDYKKYASNSFEIQSNTWRNRQKTHRFSSIELAVKIDDIHKNKITFNTDFGIGSEKYILGEEVLFLIDALKKGLKIKFIPEYIVFHPKESSGKKLNFAQLKALGKIYKITFSSFSYLFFFYFSLKKYKKLNTEGISFLDSVKTLWNS